MTDLRHPRKISDEFKRQIVEKHNAGRPHGRSWKATTLEGSRSDSGPTR